jgi:hypothetical protein
MVLAILMQVVGPDTLQIVSEPIKMLIEECLKEAALLNADSSHPFMLLCAPDVNAVTANAG